jgi:hypothetical protein
MTLTKAVITMEEDGKEKEKSRFQQSDSTANRKPTLLNSY